MAELTDTRALLAEAPFFDGMEDKYLDLLAGCGKVVYFNEGDFLLKEGEEANDFFLLRKGEAAIESHMPGNVLTVAKTGTGGITGYSWLFPPYRNQFDSRAVTDIEAVRLDGKCLRGKAEEDHELGYQFMKRLAALMLQRMQAARRQMLNIYGKTGKTADGPGSSTI
ncbi:Crp/Fnr family transcriptional regulator [Nitrosococcus oceani]|uniref:Crp/Fnr family transcriptional regulator n=1 Tax=Nitrosococcus oceani TaxID=1229 RepID=UPI00056165D6|nr:cyclic nucleotide-binding domain-containing protein [Nitrosococcus oceani]